MALEQFDIARDDLINRGLGTSSLGAQRIERMNIEDLRNLSSSLAQSRATLENERLTRASESQKLVAKQGIGALKPSGVGLGAGLGQKNLPVYITDRMPTGSSSDRNTTPDFNTGDSTSIRTYKDRYVVEIPGQSRSTHYDNLEQVYAELERRGLVGVAQLRGYGASNKAELQYLRDKGIGFAPPDSGYVNRAGGGNGGMGKLPPIYPNASDRQWEAEQREKRSLNAESDRRTREANIRESMLNEAIINSKAFLPNGSVNPKYDPKKSAGNLILIANDLSYVKDPNKFSSTTKKFFSSEGK